MTKIKICGLMRMEDISYMNEVAPDYVGFIFAKSRREISLTTALEFKQKLAPDIKSVGVFVDAPLERICRFLEEPIMDLIQLHGAEDEAYIKQLKNYTDKPIIKALAVKEPFTADLKLPADYFLFDQEKGGTGKIFDWSLLKEKKIQKPFFLAGGIDYNNVLAAIKILEPFAVDMSSGVETKGQKDPGKIREIVRRIRDER